MRKNYHVSREVMDGRCSLSLSLQNLPHLQMLERDCKGGTKYEGKGGEQQKADELGDFVIC